MFQRLKRALRSSKGRSVAESFSRIGWTGFWLQVVIGAIPVALVIYSWVFNREAGAGTRSGFAMIEYLTVAGLLVLAFTTAWFYRYTRLAARIADPGRRPPESVIQRAAWTGVVASTVGIVFSTLVMLLETVQLLIYFLRAPQAGIPVVQTTAAAAATWVSAADIVGLLSLTVTTLVEVAVLALSLWLLFRTMIASEEYPDAGMATGDGG
jgi:hypothetical protein